MNALYSDIKSILSNHQALSASIERDLADLFDSKAVIVWGDEDLIGLDASLTKDECYNIIREIEHKHDSNIGVSIDVVEVYIEFETSKRTNI